MIKIFDINKLTLDEILSRESSATGVEEIVAGIITDVKENGDTALYKYCEKFDKVKLSSLEVTNEEIEEARAMIGSLGGKVSDVKVVKIPQSDLVRKIVLIEKVKETPSQFPRKANKIKK